MINELVLASIATIAASSIGALIAARIIQAAGASTGIVVGRAIIRDLYDRDRAAGMIGLVTTAMVIAPMVAPMVGGFLDTAFGWEAIFLFITLLSGAVLLWAVLVLPETHHTGAASTTTEMWREWSALLGTPKFYAYVLAGALGSAPYFTFLGGGPHVVITLMGRSSAEYGLWFALSSFGYMMGNFTVSRLAHRVGLDAMIMAGLALGLVGAALTAVLFTVMPHGGPATVFLPQFIISYGNGLLLPNAIAGAVSLRPEAAGAAAVPPPEPNARITASGAGRSAVKAMRISTISDAASWSGARATSSMPFNSSCHARANSGIDNCPASDTARRRSSADRPSPAASAGKGTPKNAATWCGVTCAINSSTFT